MQSLPQCRTVTYTDSRDTRSSHATAPYQTSLQVVIALYKKKKEKKSCLQALRRSTRVHESSASALKKQVGLEETSQTYHRAVSNGHRSKPYSALLQGQAAVVYWLMMSKPPGDLSEKQAVYLAFWDLCFNFKPAIPDLSVGRQTSWLQYCTMGFAQETVFECNHIVCHRRNPAHRERTMSEPLVLS